MIGKKKNWNSIFSLFANKTFWSILILFAPEDCLREDQNFFYKKKTKRASNILFKTHKIVKHLRNSICGQFEKTNLKIIIRYFRSKKNASECICSNIILKLLCFILNEYFLQSVKKQVGNNSYFTGKNKQRNKSLTCLMII